MERFIHMPNIEISDADFERLQKIAVPLVDTPATVITKLIDSYQRHAKIPEATRKDGTHTPSREYGPSEVPPLTHTKLMDATFGGSKPEKTNWDAYVRLALTRVLESAGSPKELYRLSGANVVSGRKESDGYKFVSSHDFSYQGVSAEDAAKIVIRCARSLACEARFEFQWRDKAGAHMPGRRGVVSVSNA